VRAWVEKELTPNIFDWEEKGDYPKDLLAKAYDAGVLAAMWPSVIKIICHSFIHSNHDDNDGV
jgi:hypothetical protein